MCGLFGTIRPRLYDHDLRRHAATALIDLGYLAEERGTDSAGIATLHSRTLTTRHTGNPAVREQINDRWRIITALGAFTDHLPGTPLLRSNLRTARVVLGHTRWATQGDHTPDNASPMSTGNIIGTHNGDVTVPTTLRGSTDSAWLFGQLNHTRSTTSTASVLTGLRGRAALAWTRRSHPQLVYLARAALSPLATAIDQGGALWWASNPEWLRQISNWHDLELTHPAPDT